MKTFLLTATYLVGIGELALAVFFWVTHSKSEIRKVMALLAFSVSSWVILSAIIAYLPNLKIGLHIDDFIYIAGVLLTTALLHFSLIYPFPLFRIDNVHRLLLYIPALLFSVISLSSRLLVSSYYASTTFVGNIVGGPLYPYYNWYLTVLYVLSLVILFYKQRRLDGFQQKNIRIMFFSILIAGFPAVYTDLLAPMLGWPLPNFLLGVLSSVFWLGPTSYIVLKK